MKPIVERNSGEKIETSHIGMGYGCKTYDRKSRSCQGLWFGGPRTHFALSPPKLMAVLAHDGGCWSRSYLTASLDRVFPAKRGDRLMVGLNEILAEDRQIGLGVSRSGPRNEGNRAHLVRCGPS